MENYKLVMPEHLNQYGYLFGGHLLKWVDEYAWIAATLEYPGCKFVTVALDRVVFKKSVKEGTILKFIVERSQEGNTSVQYSVSVYRIDIEIAEKGKIFSTNVTLVNVDEGGKKRNLSECA
ncbi:acyl-CoA thioesterase [bacterium]|nr:acyl-CoA thioesterase [bacterium]